MKINKLAYTLLFCLLSFSCFAQKDPVYYDFNALPPHELTPTIRMQFVNSDKFTIIQWNLKSGAKLYPPHQHINEQITRILVGEVEVHSGENIYRLHAGDIMIFPANVAHGFIALTDAIVYEQQTPVREDFLQPDFLLKLSNLLQKNQ